VKLPRSPPEQVGARRRPQQRTSRQIDCHWRNPPTLHVAATEEPAERLPQFATSTQILVDRNGFKLSLACVEQHR